MKRIFLVAGESSGDSHGAALVRALRLADPSLVCEGLGGAQMAAAGMELRHDLAGEAIMGFTEIVKHFPAIRRLFLDTRDHIRASRPSAVVLIDYPGFNIRLAKALDGTGIPVIYYISPQVWAWKKQRIHTLARHVRKMLVIFPFEEDLYRKAGLDCEYVGHPLLDHIAAYEASGRFDGPCTIGLLPGSRGQEIERLLDTMIDVARGIQARHPEARFVAPCVDETRAEQIRRHARDFPLDIAPGAMHDVLAAARFCLVASGTATLETTLFGVPMAICYRVSAPSYWLARLLVDIDHIGIVNILAGREVAPEFIQHQATPERILPAALELIEDTPGRARMIDGLNQVRAQLGGGGASMRAADAILGLIEGTTHG